MIKNIVKLMYSKNGKYAVSIILGIGFSCLFRKVCKDRQCIIFRAPPIDEIKNSVYEHDNKCYKFIEKSMSCGKTDKEVSFA
jgi:hypothetical protein